MNLLRVSQYIQRFIHVYLRTWPGNYRARKLEILRELFTKGVEFMNNTREEYWLDFGTLLGYHREKGIIPHDIDVDFAMHEKSYKKVLQDQHLLPPGVYFYDSSYRHHGPKLYLSYKGFDVDIYFYEDLGDTMRSTENTKWPNERQAIQKDLIYPLQIVELFGHKVTVPHQTKAYLECIYGDLSRGAKRNLKTGFWEAQ